MQWRKRLRLNDIDQPLAYQLEDRDEGHRDPHPSFFRPEQADEFYETRVLQCGKDVSHPRTDGQSLSLDMVMREHLRTHHDILKRKKHFLERDLRQKAHDLAVLELSRSRPNVALQPRQRIDAFGSALEPLVLLQAAHELRPRVFLVAVLSRLWVVATTCAT